VDELLELGKERAAAVWLPAGGQHLALFDGPDVVLVVQPLLPVRLVDELWAPQQAPGMRTPACRCLKALHRLIPW